MPEDRAILEQFSRLSNWGRWGDDDELGTLNFITPQKMLSALAIPRYGVAVGLGRALHVGESEIDQVGQFESNTYRVNDISTHDEWRLKTHGFGMTHLDALSHTIFDERVYGGHSVDTVLGSNGLNHGSILAFGSGIITRGVLLDVASSKNVAYLPQGSGVSADDLDAAAVFADVAVEPGDAVFIRVGLQARRAELGFDGDDVRTGVLPNVNDWLYEKRVSVYSGDCIEMLPSGVAGMTHPLHQVGQVSMGLVTLDIPDMERLVEAASEFATSQFLLLVAPLRVQGASASPVNPLAVF